MNRFNLLHFTNPQPDNGTLKKVIDKSTKTAIYEPGSYNARGQMTHFAMNNKLFYPTFVRINNSLKITYVPMCLVLFNT